MNDHLIRDEYAIGDPVEYLMVVYSETGAKDGWVPATVQRVDPHKVTIVFSGMIRMDVPIDSKHLRAVNQ